MIINILRRARFVNHAYSRAKIKILRLSKSGLDFQDAEVINRPVEVERFTSELGAV